MEKLKQQEEITQMKHSTRKKKKKCNQGDQEVGQEENNQNHRCLMGKRAVALEDDKGS